MSQAEYNKKLHDQAMKRSEKLKAERARLKMSVTDFAKKHGMSLACMSRLLNKK